MSKHVCDVWVCVDCYFAHHYGSHEVDGQWFAGESDTPSDREPLNKLDRSELADNTDSETGEGLDSFSWSTCQGCGSTLGGQRMRLAVFAGEEYAAVPLSPADARIAARQDEPTTYVCHEQVTR